MVEIINNNPITQVEVSCSTAKVEIKLGNQSSIDVELQAFLKGEKGDPGQSGFEHIIFVEGGYNLQHSTQGKTLILMINNPINQATVILHPGPSPIGPIHVFGPNVPRFTYIKVLYVLGQWIKIV